ncbi:sodium:solute symporter [Duganella qianjiadongensis]|nr:sodium:solute symporter [Duganella qianjiadongensis]
MGVAWHTARHASNQSFFIGNRRSHWLLVAVGMVGTTLSGVTFISVPGMVGREGYAYLQVMAGYVVGYVLVAGVLLPLYYRMQLTSIYQYLAQRLGQGAYLSGAGCFIVARTLSGSARLYLVVNILQATLLDSLHVPFWLTASAILLMILLYTYQGGVKTLVWTDTLQTLGMLLAVVACVHWLLGQLDLDVAAGWAAQESAGLTRMFNLHVDSPGYFWKQFLAGIFIVLAMTGMDQEIMQKNISVATLRDAQKNMLLLTVVLSGVLLLFMFLGGLLSLYARSAGMDLSGDKLFPAVVMQHMPVALQLLFFLGLVSALFPSADGAMTALTASFCLDILGWQRRSDLSEARQLRQRHCVHLGFCALFLVLVLLFRWLDNPSMIGLILKLTGYTYGPILGLFAFGLLTTRTLHHRTRYAVPLVALAGPLLCYLLELNQAALFGSYRMGLELLIVNGLLVFAGLWAISRPAR